MTVLYKLESFEGPLDLLLHLIDRAEIDIHDISVSEITDQYLAYLNAMTELELEITSEFLVMAATLLSMKSRQLLPKPPVMDDYADEWMDDGLDPRDELIQKLVEYRKFKAIAEQLRDMEAEQGLVFTKEPEDLSPFMPKEQENPVGGLHVSDLIQAFNKALRRAARRNIITTVKRDEISVKDRIRDIVELLRGHSMVRFSRLIRREMDRHEIVVTFLAILELMKMKQIQCFQNRLFDDIVIQWKGEAADSELQGIETDY